jgi:hypothetical protein
LYRWYSKNKTRIESTNGDSGTKEYGARRRVAAELRASAQPRGGCHGSPPARKHRILKAAVSCHLHSLLEQQPCSTQLGGNDLTKWHPFHPSIVPYFNRILSSKHPSRVSIYHLLVRTAPHHRLPASHLRLERR